MAFRFFRRIKIAPGITLNLSKSGGSVSVGPRGAKFTVGSSGARRTVGIPGTGLFYTERIGRKNSSRASNREAPRARARNRLTLNFFQRLLTPESERELVDGMREFALGSPKRAYSHLINAPHLADAAFLAGIIALSDNRLAEAETHLLRALAQPEKLGTYFRKYEIAADVALRITERIVARIPPTAPGIRLALAEVHQALGRWEDAVIDLRALHAECPGDPMVLLSLAEILVRESEHPLALQEVVELTHAVENCSEPEAAILFWKGKSLRLLGLQTAARDTLTAAFRRKKDRSPDLLRAIQYERALAYEALGQKKRARAEFEQIYAADPAFQDVAHRLKLE